MCSADLIFKLQTIAYIPLADKSTFFIIIVMTTVDALASFTAVWTFACVTAFSMSINNVKYTSKAMAAGQ